MWRSELLLSALHYRSSDGRKRKFVDQCDVLGVYDGDLTPAEERKLISSKLLEWDASGGQSSTSQEDALGLLHEALKLCMKEEALDKLAKVVIDELEEESVLYLNLTIGEGEVSMNVFEPEGDGVGTRVEVSCSVKKYLSEVCPLRRLHALNTRFLIDTDSYEARRNKVIVLGSPPYNLSATQIVEETELSRGEFSFLVYENRKEIGDAELTSFASAVASGALPNLKKLDIRGNQIGDAGVSALASACASGALPNLTIFALDNNQIGDACMSALASACASGALPNLEKLSLRDNQIGDAGVSALASACASGALQNLTILGLGNNKIGDAGVSALASACASGAMASLEILTLRNNRIGDAGMTAFAGAIGTSGALPDLMELYLDENQIGDTGVSALASACASGALASLDTLWLQQNQIGDAGVSALASACASGAMASLEVLDLDDNQIGDAGVCALASACASGALPSISFIDLDHNQATEAGKKQMRDAAKARGFRVDLA